MKLGKLKIFLITLLAMAMSLSLFACDDVETSDPVDTTAPVITFAEGKQDTYTTTEGFVVTLPLATANDAVDGAVEVVVTVTEGATVVKTDAGYDFTSQTEGNYTVTYAATDKALNKAEETIAVTVTKAVDETAPVITFADGKQDSYITSSGTSVTLPLATANDAVDGEVELEVTVTTKGATVEKDTDGYVFTSYTAGTYKVSYYAIDEAENEVEEFITVIVTPAIDETTVSAENSDINVLENGGTYVENFANGYSGALAKGLVYSTATGEPNASVKANENSIAGNSLIIDYNSCAWNTNTGYFFGSLDKYIKSGKWTISMDVKIISGNAPSGLYFSFVYDGDTNGGENDMKTLGAVGETKTLTQTSLKNFDETKTWHFRIFFYTGDSNYKYENFVIAIDNITITYKPVVNDVVERTDTAKVVTMTEASAENGYTVDGKDNNYTALTGSAKYLEISKIVDSDRLTEDEAANLTAANGFNSKYVICAETQIISFDAFKNLCTDSKYIYTITMKVYAKSANNWHIFITDGSRNQVGAKQQPNVKGTSTFTYEFAGSANYVNVGLYNGASQPLYVGDITIKAVPKAADKSPKGYTVGTKWTKDFDALNSFNKGTKVNTLEEDVSDGLLGKPEHDGFETYAVKFTSADVNKTFELFKANETIENGCTYKIKFTMYVSELTGRICVNFDNTVFETITTTTGYQVAELNWTATKTVDFFSLYFDDSSKGTFYVASISYELTAI